MKRRIISLLLVCFFLCVSLPACNNGGGKDANAVNPLVADTTWIGNGDSELIFNGDGTFVWYKDEGKHDDNYYSGTFRFYRGAEAKEVLIKEAEEKYGTSEERWDDYMDNTSVKDYTEDNLIVFVLHHEVSIMDGKDAMGEREKNDSLETIYFGFVTNDDTYLDVANMSTLNYYGFTLKK